MAPITAPAPPATAPPSGRLMHGPRPPLHKFTDAPMANPPANPNIAPKAACFARDSLCRYHSILITSSRLAITVPTVTPCGVQFWNSPSTGPVFKDTRTRSPGRSRERDSQSCRSCPIAAVASAQRSHSLWNERMSHPFRFGDPFPACSAAQTTDHQQHRERAGPERRRFRNRCARYAELIGEAHLCR
jgi:hypothetical protein